MKIIIINVFGVKIEETLKWGNKISLKENLTKKEQKAYSLFRDGVEDFIKALYNDGIKIFIICKSDYSFVKKIFNYYKLSRCIEGFFTPSRCGLPRGRINSKFDYFNDCKKINKERIFVCIERYVGRLPDYVITPPLSP